jgi:hypothetical protein
VMTIFCDAAWNDQVGAERKPAGHGVTINIQGNNEHLKQIHVATLASSIFSSLSRDPHYYTDSLVLSSATRASSVFAAPGHWENRPLLAEIQASRSFHSNRITHIRMCDNVKEDHLARLAHRVQNRPLVVRCLGSVEGSCPAKDILCVSRVSPFRLTSVKCT